jgi:hypothetical protein
MTPRPLRFRPIAARLASRACAASLAAASALAIAAPASAELCSARPNPVYVTGGGKVAVSNLGKVLSSSGITVVYKLQGSCLALDAILNGTPLTGKADKGGTYYDATGDHLCDFDDAGNTTDVAISDVFPSSCMDLPNGLPKNVGDHFGPVEAYSFVVPKASKQRSISKAAAYFVYGFGSDSGVEPWTDESLIFQRGATSGTQQMMALAIDVPASVWRGVTASSSADVVAKLSMAAQPERAIGIVTAEVAGTDANRLVLNQLAYQDDLQSCAYFPDSTPTTLDKRNVRDGHYSIWGPLHLLTRIDPSTGFSLNKNAGDLVGYITGTKEPPNNFDLIALFAVSNIVPQCAMQVSRDSELGPLSSFAPAKSCACYFEQSATGTAPAGCKACSTDMECDATLPRCNYGFCEAQ